MIWMFPLCMLAGHWFCGLVTALDPGHKNRNKKTLTMIFWIIPITTWFCSAIMFGLYMGLDVNVSFWMCLMMGILFTAIGNYMPKTKMNSTVGIKVPWAYTSEENWNATHRFAGKVWVIGGILLLPCMFLPEDTSLSLFFLDTAVLCILPMGYSWRYWKKQKDDGAELKMRPSGNSRLTAVSLILLSGVLIFTLSILFVGDINYTFGADRFTVDASWYSDLTVRYDSIEELEYRNGDVPGMRVGGFGSLRLLMGYFSNEEFGTHIRYTYYKPESCIIVKTDRYRLILSGKTAADTQVLYEQLLAKIG